MGPHRMPAAEVDVSPDLVRRLLSAQQPDLAGLPIKVIANGWDNVLCRVGDELVARLPRRAAAAPLIVHEQRWLPVLQPQLPLPVPAPVRAGQPGLGYPWPWSIVPFLPGQVAAKTPPADLREAAIGLGRFLGALHAPAAPDAPANAFRGIPLAQRDATLTQNLSVLSGLVDQRAVRRVWEAAVATPAWSKRPVWVHGDLHPANLLVHRGRLSAVLDFGDITSGDPATDLSDAVHADAVTWRKGGSHDERQSCCRPRRWLLPPTCRYRWSRVLPPRRRAARGVGRLRSCPDGLVWRGRPEADDGALPRAGDARRGEALRCPGARVRHGEG